MKEIWKEINNFPNYEVSNLGVVRKKKCTIIYSNGMVTNYKERILKQEANRINYKRVTLSQNNIQKRFQTHRLVAEYFSNNPENKLCVNHIDGNPSNNKVSNLEWCTYSENERHSYDILGKINANRKLSEDQISDILKNCIKGDTTNVVLFTGNVRFFAEKYNVSTSTIRNVVNKNYYV